VSESGDDLIFADGQAAGLPAVQCSGEKVKGGGHARLIQSSDYGNQPQKMDSDESCVIKLLNKKIPE